jgi:hypothetical protein
MARIGKYLTILLVVILAVTSLNIAYSSFAQSYPVIIASPTPEPTLHPVPTPTPTNKIALDYSEISRATEGSNTILVLAVDATYYFGEQIMINFQDFTLNIAVERGGPPPIQAGDYIFTGTAKPTETGSIIIDNSNNKAAFQLTFVFSTLQNNAHGQTPFTNYELIYSGSTTTTTPTPSPTVPEFPITAILIAVLFVGSLLAVIGKKKLTAEHS